MCLRCYVGDYSIKLFMLFDESIYSNNNVRQAYLFREKFMFNYELLFKQITYHTN